MGKEVLAFNDQLYKKEVKSIDRVIEDDFISYLGEYRFEVPEFDYRMGLSEGKLTDPNTREPMTQKTKKAIFQRQREGFSASREEAELTGFLRFEQKLSENPFGTVVWFSPKGPEEQGYGDYGFAYVGKRDKDGVLLTAIRLNGSTISQFNQVSEMLGIGVGFKKAEDFLANPWVIEKSVEDVKEIVKKQFGTTDNGAGEKLKKAKDIFAGHFRDFTEIVKYGSQEAIGKAKNAIEHVIIEYIKSGEENRRENVVFIPNFRVPVLGVLMEMSEYNRQPELARGSCGSSGRKESNNIFGGISRFSYDKFSSRQEWFNCPKCNFKANGPVGDTCPGCGLTKEQFAESGNIMCE